MCTLFPFRVSLRCCCCLNALKEAHETTLTVLCLWLKTPFLPAVSLSEHEKELRVCNAVDSVTRLHPFDVEILWVVWLNVLTACVKHCEHAYEHGWSAGSICHAWKFTQSAARPLRARAARRPRRRPGRRAHGRGSRRRRARPQARAVRPQALVAAALRRKQRATAPAGRPGPARARQIS